MGQFENVLRGDLFLWFLASLFFTMFVIIKLIKNLVDINQERTKPEQRYGEGQKQKQPQRKIQDNQSMERFDKSVIKAQRANDNDSVMQRWVKKVYEYQVYFMPILFPFALNVMTGNTYSFLIIMFFISALCFMLFNMWKIHRQCVEHKVLRVILESLAYVLSFFLLLNVWPTGTNVMPYSVQQRTW